MLRWLLVLALLLAGCGGDGSGDDGGGDDQGGGEAPQISVEAEQAGDQITVSVETDLPNDAVLSWDAWDDDPQEVAENENVGESGEMTVTSEQASAVVDGSRFNGDVYIEVSFDPEHADQPDEVSEQYGSDSQVREETTVTLEEEGGQ